MHLVFTGSGKGKTTAAIGTGIRFVGTGKHVLMVQFIKGPWTSGEHATLKRLAPDFKIVKTGKGFVGILGDTLPLREHMQAAEEGLAVARREIDTGFYHLLILDEIHNAIALGLIDTSLVIDFLDYAKDKVRHIITTGRDAPQEIINRADLVTEMREIKHPYQKGIKAEEGIDF